MIKKAALELLSLSGAFAPFRWKTSSDVLVLMYHRFGRINDGVTVPPEVFARQVAYLKAHYQVVPISEVADRLKSGEPLPRGLAVITVDDGYNDFYDTAFPILRKAGVTATVFLVSDFVSQTCWMPADRPNYLTAEAAPGEYHLEIGPARLRVALGDAASRDAAAGRINMALLDVAHEERTEAVQRIARALGLALPAVPPKEFGGLRWDQVREMAIAGIEFGSHTVSHAMLTQVSETRMEREIADSRIQIGDEIGRPCEVFSYPNGEMNDRIRNAVVRAGYRGAGSSVPGFNDAQVDPFTIRRIYADVDFPHFVQTTSGCEQVKFQLRNALRN